jgi:antitoxin component YwqK of YwqJK toxin-antitoxin module
MYYSAGAVRLVEERNSLNQRHGMQVKWHRNGNVQEISEWINGNRHGTSSYWYDNKQLSETSTYLNGQEHGLCTMYNESGSVFGVIIYYEDKNITHHIEKIVNDIENITSKEKTQIALQFGLLL